MHRYFYLFLPTAFLRLGCSSDDNDDSVTYPKFENAELVSINGYEGDAMEPLISRDGNYLLFNNLTSVDANLHWATKISETSFEYQGEITGVNTTSLEGVPTMDENGTLYFVSTRDYDQTLTTLYKCDFENGIATNVSQVDGLSKMQIGWLNFDVDTDPSGQTLYFVDGRFDQNGGPYEAEIVIATKTNSGFQRLSNSNDIMKNINTEELEYAACISNTGLELYFTRLDAPITAASTFKTFVAVRKDITEPFSAPQQITAIEGYAEAPALSPDNNSLYFHKQVDDKFSIFRVKRK